MSETTAKDARDVGDKAAAFFTAAAEQVRTPLLAALGAGDLAASAISDALGKAKDKVKEGASAAQKELPADFSELKEKLDPAELRKLLDSFSDAALNLYHYLADHGEETLDKLRSKQEAAKAEEPTAAE